MIHALTAEGRTWTERGELAADLASPVRPDVSPDPDDEGPAVVVPDEIPAWMQGLIP